MSITLHLSDEPELPASAPAPEPRAPRGHGKHQMSWATLKDMASGPMPGLIRGEQWHHNARQDATTKPNAKDRRTASRAAADRR